MRLARSTSSSALSRATLPICLRYARTESAEAVISASLRACRSASDSSSSSQVNSVSPSSAPASAVPSAGVTGVSVSASSTLTSTPPVAVAASAAALAPLAADFAGAFFAAALAGAALPRRTCSLPTWSPGARWPSRVSSCSPPLPRGWGRQFRRRQRSACWKPREKTFHHESARTKSVRPGSTPRRRGSGRVGGLRPSVGRLSNRVQIVRSSLVAHCTASGPRRESTGDA